MRWCFPLLFFFVVACGGEGEPLPEPLEVPPVVEAPTPPPLPATDDLNSLLPQEPSSTSGGEHVEKTPVALPTPKPTNQVPAGAKPITFDKVVVAASVANRAPVGESTSFKSGVEVSCWMAVTNPGPKRRLSHQWFHDTTRKSNIPVKVGGPTWRTWTSRPVYTPGPWRVDIVDEGGRVLHSVSFEVQ